MNNKLFLCSWVGDKLVHILLSWLLAYTFFAIIPNLSTDLSQYYVNRGLALFCLSGVYFFVSVLTFLAINLSMISERSFLVVDLVSLVFLLVGSLLLAGNYGFLAAI